MLNEKINILYTSLLEYSRIAILRQLCAWAVRSTSAVEVEHGRILAPNNPQQVVTLSKNVGWRSYLDTSFFFI